jgi:hypothetical protein
MVENATHLGQTQKLSKPFQRCLIMCGGGFRTGYYFGVYQALEEARQQPDIILAACSGAIAAMLLRRTGSAKLALDYALSADMHHVFTRYRVNLKFKPSKALWGVLGRFFGLAAGNNAHLSNPLFSENQLFDAPPQADTALRIATLLAKRQDENHGDGRGENQGESFSEYWCADAELVAPIAAFGQQVRAFDQALSPQVAGKLSQLDPFYFSPESFEGTQFLGGAINLFPVALAGALATDVIGEYKPKLSGKAVLPAWRSVFGIDGARMQARADQFPYQYAFDARDIRSMPNVVDRSFYASAPHFRFGVPSLGGYQERLKRQFDFGYQRMKAAIVKR